MPATRGFHMTKVQACNDQHSISKWVANFKHHKNIQKKTKPKDLIHLMHVELSSNVVKYYHPFKKKIGQCSHPHLSAQAANDGATHLVITAKAALTITYSDVHPDLVISGY